MSDQVRSYRIPTSLDEALELLSDDSAALVAGATMRPFKLPPRVKTLVDVTRCGLEGLRVEGQLFRVGATTRAAELAAREELDGLGTGVLREAAAAVAPLAVRNQATVGGNLVGLLSWSDLPVALLALKARVTAARAGGKERVLSVEELLAQHPRKVLAPGEVVTSVDVERPPARTGGAFLKEAATSVDVAWVDVAAVLTVRDGVCREARIAVGAVRPRPFRAEAAEAALSGVELSEEACAAAGRAAAEEAHVGADLRASPEYRRRLVGVLVKRAVRTAWRRATGEETYAAPRRTLPDPWTTEAPGEGAGRILSVVVDGRPRRFHVGATDTLLDVLRRNGFVAVKHGCDTGYCGSCSVLVDGRLLNACLVLAPHVEGCSLTTGAGLGTAAAPHPLQRAFVATGAVQCGFCTPGMLLAAKALLDQVPDPTGEEVREALDGNLCRCTGYVKPLEAVHKAAVELRRGEV